MWLVKRENKLAGFYMITTRDIKKFHSEDTLQMCSYQKVLWKYAANLQENIHVEVQFQ